MGQAQGVWMTAEREREISAEVVRQGPRLRNFVRRRIADAAEAEDILQDVFLELVAASVSVHPLEDVTAWLYRVARNRIIDFWRKRSPSPPGESRGEGEDEGEGIEDLLPSSDAGPEAAYARSVMLEEIDAALNELPAEQRDVFIAHELEGRSFKEIAAATGVGVNTLLSRKRYAVLHLRERLQSIHDEFLGTGE